MDLSLSFIIPVYNRPEEIKELLQSFVGLDYDKPYEIVIVEDGSSRSSKEIVESFSDRLNITYLQKENSGPGDSRNYGMKRAKGNYFIILDSDCILPSDYFKNVIKSLKENYAACFGGPDTAHPAFTPLQKAINFSMTSFISTGGIRGNKRGIDKFQPRSFNMGISKEAFDATGGFGRIHPGEDPDLSIRLTKLGYKTKLIPEAYVYHKRRISWRKFFNQVRKFGLVRPILNAWHPETKKLTYWFPLLFNVGLIVSIFLAFIDVRIPLIIYTFYFILAFIVSLLKTKNLVVAFLSLLAILIQFFGYGIGFLEATVKIGLLKHDPEKVFPNLFFKLSDAKSKI